MFEIISNKGIEPKILKSIEQKKTWFLNVLFYLNMFYGLDKLIESDVIPFRTNIKLERRIDCAWFDSTSMHIN